MKNFVNRERVIALICIIFAVWMFCEAGKFPTSALDTVGSSLYPRFLAAVIGVAALVQFAVAKDGSKPLKGKREFLPFGLLVGSTVVYLIAMPRLGFIPATIVFLLVLTCIFDRRDWRTKLKTAIPYSILFTLGMYFFFAKLLGILLPGSGS